MDLLNARGTRDFLPKEKLIRNNIQETIVKVFELYGFSPFETPLIERFDILSSKYTGGEEILKETFKFKDQGKRELGIRYDLTVPLSRFIGMNQQMKMPAKLYQLGNVLRDGPVSQARYRQFMQCDVDIIGAKSVLAETELLSIASEAFDRLDIKVEIKFNNRKFLNEILHHCGVKKEQNDTVILSIDKLEKFGEKEVEKELKQKKIPEKTIKKVMETITVEGFNDEKVEKFKKILKNSEGLKEIEDLLKYLNILDIEVTFDPALARGLSYYTGTVFEVKAKQGSITSSICAGGRYDNMIGSLLGRGDYPATGISFGLDRIYDVILESEKPTKKVVTKVYIIPIKTVDISLKTLDILRKEGIPADIDLSERGPSKNLDYANTLNIPYVIFIGKKEIENGKLTLRDMKSGKEESLPIDQVVKKLK
ncbi:histidine--tRNA ligase [Nanoarchaeota archaeon]